MTLNNTDPDTNGVSIVSNSQITVANPGVYNIQFSAQIDRITGSGTDVVNIWFKKNGNNILESNTIVTISGPAVAAKTVAAWNYMLELNSGDYIQIFWYTTDANISLLPANSSGSIPAVPSLIVTVQQVMYTQLGPTGFTGPKGPTGALGTGPTGVTGPTGPLAATPNLQQVLAVGNAAGPTGINLNNRDIINGGTITSNLFAGDLSGNATSSTTVLVTSSNTGGSYYLPFVGSTGTGKKSLYIDDTTTPSLAYTPTTQTLSVGAVKDIFAQFNKVYYFDTSSIIIDASSILTNGMIYMSSYTTFAGIGDISNNIITVTLPPPTATIEGLILLFRKLRGANNSSNTNWFFNSTNSYNSFIPSSSSVQGNNPNPTYSTNTTSVRIVTAGFPQSQNVSPPLLGYPNGPTGPTGPAYYYLVV